ncbi:hypothetical protein EST38_g10602 [Candolleomyces aberdarensis]|uniref:PARP catalytic domain-containing protein n=2 Tax=Candolleomyces aberdarensis TaxID=2316362 RepID=A0A4Q2D6Y9_9AGAR|nr:hypothetical protein EST38_g10602 [Candolleomyces aberdarensis]
MYLLAGLVAILGITTVEALPVQTPEFASVYRRTGTIQHPQPNEHSFLFHGTTPLDAVKVIQKPLLSKTHGIGDLHCNEKGGSEGGFYLTDSAMAAAQFVCWGDKKLGTDKKLPPRVRIAHVLKFEWSPPANIRSRVTTLQEQDPDNQEGNDLCKDKDVLSG